MLSLNLIVLWCYKGLYGVKFLKIRGFNSYVDGIDFIVWYRWE